MQIGLGIVWTSIFIDSCENWKYVSRAESEVASAMVMVVGVGSFLLFLPIGVLLITQMMSACANVTTL